MNNIFTGHLCAHDLFISAPTLSERVAQMEMELKLAQDTAKKWELAAKLLAPKIELRDIPEYGGRAVCISMQVTDTALHHRGMEVVEYMVHNFRNKLIDACVRR